MIWPTRNFTIVDKNEAAGAAVARLARMRALTGIGQSTFKSVHCSIAPQTPDSAVFSSRINSAGLGLNHLIGPFV